ncbi:JERKL-like protein, partial [Mya arenaria]
NMGPKRRGAASSCRSPAQKSAKAIAKKYRGKKMTPEKAANVRRALYSVCNEKLSLRKAAREYGVSYGFLYRRYSGEVDIEKIKGLETVFSSAEEKSMAKWLSEMAQRGMGLRVCEFLDFVQDIVQKENRQTPFKDGRPSYQRFTAFKHRNGNIIDRRTETPLELKRSKLSKSVIDEWYSKYRNFLISIDCLDKPSRIWNADESGFNMGSASAKVIGPTRRDLAVPHITAGKQRLTVMYCGRATGEMMPPFFVFPEPKPRSYNPLNGSLEGSAIAYTKKGWMDSKTFDKFIDHFDKYAGQERPVVLLIDSVGSHVDHTVFMHAKAKGIEIYRIVPNATHLMQPLDKGVFGPLKGKWNLVSRRYSRENPGKTIGKENFAEKLNVAYLEFYKPLTVINAFKSSGIYPVDSMKITSEMLKPGLTFSGKSLVEEEKAVVVVHQEELHETARAKGALSGFEETLATPVRDKYNNRIEEGYDMEGISPCFDVYRKLHKKAHPSKATSQATGLDLLADTALQDRHAVLPEDMPPSSSLISPVLRDLLVFPKAPESLKPVRKTLVNTLPDNLTSSESIRTLSLRELEKVKSFAERERKARLSFIKKNKPQKKGKSKSNTQKGKMPKKTDPDNVLTQGTSKEFCKGCQVTWDEDIESDSDCLWVQCDLCDGWLHAECISGLIDTNEQFICPDCMYHHHHLI